MCFSLMEYVKSRYINGLYVSATKEYTVKPKLKSKQRLSNITYYGDSVKESRGQPINGTLKQAILR